MSNGSDIKWSGYSYDQLSKRIVINNISLNLLAESIKQDIGANKSAKNETNLYSRFTKVMSVIKRAYTLYKLYQRIKTLFEKQ